jgi:ABC-type glycerol-3-phosphate transport system substrate-binding protein
MNKLNTTLGCLLLASAALLSACGGGGGSTAEAPKTGEVVTITAVVAYINSLFANTSDSSTPVDANLVNLAENNTAEPEPVN